MRNEDRCRSSAHDFRARAHCGKSCDRRVNEGAYKISRGALAWLHCSAGARLAVLISAAGIRRQARHRALRLRQNRSRSPLPRRIYTPPRRLPFMARRRMVSTSGHSPFASAASKPRLAAAEPPAYQPPAAPRSNPATRAARGSGCPLLVGCGSRSRGGGDDDTACARAMLDGIRKHVIRTQPRPEGQIRREVRQRQDARRRTIERARIATSPARLAAASLRP